MVTLVATLLLALSLVGCSDRHTPSPTQTSAVRPARIPAAKPVGAAWPEDQPLTILTYNVLASPIYTELRTRAILEILEKSDAHIIALQEVDEWFLEALVAAPWVKERYHLSADDGQPVAPGGQLILAKQPLRSLSVLVMPGRQRRTLMIAELDIRGRRLRVATTHLESFLEDGPVRARQLDGIFDLLKQADDAVLMGDLNFGDGDQPETAHLDPSYLDLWRELLPKDPGFTWNMRENPLARIGAFVGEPDRRLDRILLRSDAWRPRSIALIGDHAVATRPLTRDDRRLIEMPNRPPVAGTEDIEVFPSDHYGLTATLVPR